MVQQQTKLLYKLHIVQSKIEILILWRFIHSKLSSRNKKIMNQQPWNKLLAGNQKSRKRFRTRKKNLTRIQ